MRYDRALQALAAVFLVSAAGADLLSAQEAATLPPDSIALRDLAAFGPAVEGWRIVASATADRSRDHRIITAAGTGVLANVARPGDGGDLRTSWEHGDIDLELEFMMPRASNSGIYFQGRYELQLLDSWGVENPTYGDVGGIYERWDESRGAGREGFEGHAPRLNAARAPGLWQTLRVEFRAPRFDSAGRKVANARFASVELNGAVIHENIELDGPTRGASQPGEAALGPIVIQGDHGPVAFRRIRFKRYGAEPLRLSNVSYRVHEGEFRSLPETGTLAAVRSGTAEEIGAAAAGVADRFALVHEGTIHLPSAGEYLLELRLNWLDGGEGEDGSRGGGRLTIGGREVLLHSGRGRAATARVSLPAGAQPFALELFKNREGRPASFTLYAEGPGVARQALHGAAGPQRGSAAGAILVEPADEPYLLRSFLQHGDEKRTHVISVGEPDGVHYSYDAESAAVLAVWRGPFLETTQMWEGRGEPQLAEPLGSVVSFSAAPAIALLPTADAAWPDSMPEAAGHRFHGYTLDDGRRPTFRHSFAGASVEDRIRPLDGRSGFRRELVVSGGALPPGTHLRLAVGETVERLRDGAYIVDGRYYLIPVRGAPTPVVRATAEGQELLMPLTGRGGGAARYDIVW